MLKLLLVCFLACQLVLASGEGWAQYKLVHGKSYESKEEDRMRRLNWENAVERIREHNARYDAGLETYRQAINHLADRTEDEINELLGVEIPDDYEKYENMPVESEMLDNNLPAEVDWVKKGYVTPIKNQKRCGSCWTFSTCASLEALVKSKYGKLKNLSEQQLVDCCGSEYSGHGCRGGWPPRAFMYTHRYGVEPLTQYPYKAEQGSCKYNSKMVVIKNNQTWHTTSGTENLLKKWVAYKGVVSVAIQVTTDFQYYSSGVFHTRQCTPGSVNHAVAVVGYGTENGQDYWLVKNSWGTYWGEKGYIKMARNRGNMCSIAQYPVVGNAM